MNSEEDVLKVGFNTLPGDCKSRLHKQNPFGFGSPFNGGNLRTGLLSPPPWVINRLVHGGGLRLCSSGFNRRMLLEHPLSNYQLTTSLGNSTRNVEPSPSKLSTVIVPPIKSSKSLTIVNPNPVP